MRKIRSRVSLFAVLYGLLALLLGFAGCGGGSGSSAGTSSPSPAGSGASGPSSAGGQNVVAITIPAGAMNLGNKAFQPNPANVSPGMTVIWTNQDSVTHTATADDGSFDSGDIAPGASWSWSVPSNMSASQINYHCKIHPGMTGTLQLPSMTMGTGTPGGNECLGMPDGTPCNGEPCARACSGAPGCESKVYFFCQSNSCHGAGVLCARPQPSASPTP